VCPGGVQHLHARHESMSVPGTTLVLPRSAARRKAVRKTQGTSSRPSLRVPFIRLTARFLKEANIHERRWGRSGRRADVIEMAV